MLRSSQQVVLDRLYEQLQQRIDFWENAETTSLIYREIRIEEIATTMRVIGEVTDYTYQQSKAALKTVDDGEPIEDIFELIPFDPSKEELENMVPIGEAMVRHFDSMPTEENLSDMLNWMDGCEDYTGGPDYIVIRTDSDGSMVEWKYDEVIFSYDGDGGRGVCPRKILVGDELAAYLEFLATYPKQTLG